MPDRKPTAALISRRAVIAGASAVGGVSQTTGSEPGAICEPILKGAMGGSTTSNAQETFAEACHRWLAIDDEKERQQIAWSDHESWLARQYGWLHLSKVAQEAIPEGRRLSAIDARLDALERQSESLLRSLPAITETSLESIVIGLRMAERLLHPDDHPLAHSLIALAARDLSAVSLTP